MIRNALIVRVLSLTLFASAFLLFWSEPMVAKMVLPFVGGTSAVWIVCLLFFQLMLLGGYLYAHVLARFRNVRHRILVHLSIVFLSMAFLPIHFDSRMMGQSPADPTIWLLGRLFVGAGIPFFVIATTTPLLQNWFAATSHESATDPYFLYVASNAGSLGALLLQPILFEPLFGVSVQARWWTAGYRLLAVCIAGVACLVWMQSRPLISAAKSASTARSRPDLRTRAFCLFASFVPSALMLAVTNHINTNVASAPFLWVAPLAVYLLTFVLAFSGRVSETQVSRATPLILVVCFALTGGGITAPPPVNWVIVTGHIVLLFSSALLCHVSLNQKRPVAEHLTEFYFWISLGGVLGGVFTALIAPAIFRTVLEYPLLIAAVPFLREVTQKHRDLTESDRSWKGPALIGVLAGGVCVLFGVLKIPYAYHALVAAQVMFTLAIFRVRERTRPFALAFAALIITNAVMVPRYVDGGQRVYVARNFFGVKTVLDDPANKMRRLVQGDTVHGMEGLDAGRSGQALAYYHATGPVGDAMRVVSGKRPSQVAVIGLGAGAIAAYAQPTTTVTFFEVDPEIETIARRYFTFLDRCGNNCRVFLGDGRIELARSPDSFFNLIVLDAFSSDAVPAHLVSREALQLYLSKLAGDGLLLFHVSNRYLDLVPLVAALADDAHLSGLVRDQAAGNTMVDGIAGGSYIIAARRAQHLGPLTANDEWRQLPKQAFRVWTDDYSNLAAIVRFR